MNRVISFLILLIFSFSLQAQDQFMVFFKDKSNTSFSIQRPAEFLSTKAISRRSKQSITITEEDLPVNRSYVRGVADLGIETYFTTKWMNGLLVQMEASSVNAVLALPYVDRVEYVAPNAILSNAPGAVEQTDESPIDPSRIEESQYKMLGLNQMHEEGFFGEDVLIAIFDAGFKNYSTIPAFEHILQDNRLIHTFDYTKNRISVDNNYDHGLRVFSILGADAEMIGAVPHASYMLVVTEASVGEYRIEEYNWLFAAEMADSAGVDIVNTSLGYSEFSDPAMDYTQSQLDGQTTVITRAANIAASKGILLVNSSGNEGSSSWGTISAPSDSEKVLTVGAINVSEQLASFSGTGPTADNRIKPDVVALGVNTQVTNAQNIISFQNGTSFSAPLVTGLAAGLIQAFPEMSSQEIMEVIKQSGDRIENPNSDFGNGIPHFVRAAKIADESLIPLAAGIIAYPNPTDLTYFTLTFSESMLGQEIKAQLLNGDGSLVQNYEFTPKLFNNRLQVDLSTAKSGLLLLRLVTADGVTTKKIIKIK